MDKKNPRRIFNVTVLGFSVGMTFSYAEALSWRKKCTDLKTFKIIPVPYNMERPSW